MVGRIRPQTGASAASPRLRVTFYRCGLERDSQVAPTSERALKTAIVMLASLDDLIDGDKLTVTVIIGSGQRTSVV
jgi:hypothetical protein